MTAPRWGRVAAGLALAFGLSAKAASAQAANGPVTIESSLDRDTAGLDQLLQLTVNVTVRGGVGIDQFELPHAPVLQTVGSSKSEQSRFSMGPGGIDSSHSTVYRVTLKPLRVGDFMLSPAQVVAGGKVYKGAALRVRIVAAGAGPPPVSQPTPNNPFGGFGLLPPGFGQPPAAGGAGSGSEDDADPFAQFFGGSRPQSGEDVILGASVDHKQVVLGQQLTYTIRLYTRAEVNEISDLKLPGFDGFWGEDLESPTRPVPKVQTLGGVPYQVYLIKKRALFPDRAGALAIDPAEIDVGVGLGFFRGRKLHRQSAPLSIEVQPLPAGAPAGFPTTNVGNWHFTASLSPASVPVGEPATLTLVAEGFGNLHGLTLPTLPAIDGIRQYDPTSTDRVQPQGDRFGGRRQVDIILIPQRTGEFSIPSVAFQWFEPAVAETSGGTLGGAGYRVAQTPPLTLKAVVGLGGQGAIGAAAGGQNLLESAFRPLRDRPTLAADCQRRTWRLPELPAPLAIGGTFAAPPAALTLLALAGAWRERRRRSAPAQRGRRAFRRAQQRLAQAGGVGAAQEVAQALFDYLSDRFGETFSGLTYPDLRQRLLARGIEEAAVGASLAAVELSDAVRYQPGGVGAAELEKLKGLGRTALEALERSRARRGPKLAPRPAQ